MGAGFGPAVTKPMVIYATHSNSIIDGNINQVAARFSLITMAIAVIW
jgi:hypothetical protein